MAKKKTKKQESWFRTEVNFENSLKWWFALQWQNGYIQLFALFFTGLILQLCNFNTVWEWILDAYSEGTFTGIFITSFMFLPIAGAGIIAYKGFYQFFNDRKNGTSR